MFAVIGLGIDGYLLGDTETKQWQASKIEDHTAVISRGEYLVRAGNCIGCHTARGGSPLAGGRILQSEFGEFVTPNITPDVHTGIGSWSADDFWRALHNGKGKDGRLLYPAFPFENYTQVSRADADAMYAYLREQQVVEQKNQLHRLRFPYNQRYLLALWRAFFFRPAIFVEDKSRSVLWNRGAYLVNGLGHCSACHSSRNLFGANRGNQDLSGGEMPQIHWYAPSLLSEYESGLATWRENEVRTLLSTGVSSGGTTLGPMSDVVANSLQYLNGDDIQAMQVYLQALPHDKATVPDAVDALLEAPTYSPQNIQTMMRQGGPLYTTHCASCHGDQGEGVPFVYPALKNSSAVKMAHAGNLIRVTLAGGFAPSTQKNPRPYGMPPFAPVLSDIEVALILTYVRNAWGNHAAPVAASDVNQYRTAPLD